MTTSTNQTLALTRAETITGMLDEYEAFAALVASLSERDWATPTRCDGFDVRDVAGHVIGLAEDVVAGRPGSRSAEEEAASVRDDQPAQAAARLSDALDVLRTRAGLFDNDEVWDGPSGAPGLTLAEGLLVLWYDTYVHADDIRAALGRSPEAGPGERAALLSLRSQLQQRGFGPARIELTDHDGLVIEIGPVDESTPTTRVAAHELILAATGRLDARSVGLDPAINIYAPDA